VDGEIFVVPTSATAEATVPRQITSGARGQGKTNGIADYVAQEEMDQYRGFWWSPDSTKIAFTQVGSCSQMLKGTSCSHPEPGSSSCPN